MATILNEFLNSSCGEELDKTKFAETLGDILVSEIRSVKDNGGARNKQQFEIEADKVVGITKKPEFN